MKPRGKSPPAAAGGCKEERKRERLSERPVESLTRTTPPQNRARFHRVVSATRRMARQVYNQWLENLKLANHWLANSSLYRVCGRSGFGLWSASGESGAQTERRRERSRSTTPAAEPQTEARRFCGTVQMPLVTSARFEKRSGRRREGDRDDGQPVKRSKPARWSRRKRLWF